MSKPRFKTGTVVEGVVESASSAGQRVKCLECGREFKSITNSHLKLSEDIVHASRKLEE